MPTEPVAASLIHVTQRRKWKLGLVAAALFLSIALSAFLVSGNTSSPKLAAKKTHTIARGDLVVTVTEQGTLASAKNTEIKCQVRGGYGGRGGMSTVTWVISPGSVVESGDELVRLDTKVLEETVSLGKTDTNNAIAALARAKADLAKAQITVDAYQEGRYRSQMTLLEKQLAVAERNLRTSKEMHGNSEHLFRQGFVTQLEVLANSFTVTRAELELNVVKTQMDVHSRLTRKMELETLKGQLLATKARVNGREAGVHLEQGRLDLAREELAGCIIKAPKGGLVIYPSAAKWKDAPDIDVGASVHNNQVLLLMPDLSQMQVVIGVHESIVDRVQAGQDVRVKLPGKTINTKVHSVAEVAQAAGWWTGNAVKYDTTIRLPNLEGLYPGMSADVEVMVAKHNNVLLAPVTAVLQTRQGHFCWVETTKGPQKRSLKIGNSNDQFIIVEQGLAEGDEVLLDPLESVDMAQAMIRAEQTYTVKPTDLDVTLTEQGALESSNNTQIKCKVRGQSTINWVVENGTRVEEGDELVRLENKQIEEFLHERTKYAHLSRDAAIGFRAEATVAGLAIDEYMQGRYRIELMTLEKDLAIAEARLRSAQNMLDHAQVMFQRGYRSELEVQQQQFAVKQATLAADLKQTEIEVLKNFTKEEELKTLRGGWESAKAAANGHEEVLKMDEARVALAHQELQRCVVRAERSGLVIYPSNAKWKDTPDVAEGATVHYDQVLLLMPDLSKMQVRLGVHESMVDQIKPEMHTTVTLPHRKLEGRVTSVASAAQPASWWTGNIVKYDVTVELPSVEGLKPGMSAELEILIAEHHDVLAIPLTAVVETELGAICFVDNGNRLQQRRLRLGDSNEEFVIVERGLEEGMQVVLAPTNVSSNIQVD